MKSDASDFDKANARKLAVVNARLFEKCKSEKMQELMMMLELFDGKLTLSEILNTDLSTLYQLRDAKLEIKRLAELQQQKQRAEAEAKKSAGKGT